MTDWSRELRAAIEAARAAGDAARTFFGGSPRVAWKPDASPVSQADHAADAVVRERLGRAFPGDAILTEESGGRPGTSGRRWIVDPLDGTRGFLRGLPFWCVLVALEADGDVAVGVLHLPVLGTLYAAARGQGAWRDGQRLEIRDAPDVGRADLVLGELDTVTATLGAATLGRLAGALGSVRAYGAGYGAALVLDGRADAWAECDVAPWDIAPFGVLFEEAGARYTDLAGFRAWPTRSALAAAPALHRALLGLLEPGGA